MACYLLDEPNPTKWENETVNINNVGLLIWICHRYPKTCPSLINNTITAASQHRKDVYSVHVNLAVVVNFFNSYYVLHCQQMRRVCVSFVRVVNRIHSNFHDFNYLSELLSGRWRLRSVADEGMLSVSIRTKRCRSLWLIKATIFCCVLFLYMTHI